MSEILRVKDTNLINIRPCDVLLYRAGAFFWPDFDVLGGIIRTFEGNEGTARDPKAAGFSSGDYTHCAWVRDVPDPEAEVEEVSDRPGIYKIKDGQTWKVQEILPGRWAEEPTVQVDRIACKMGVRVHSTWPCVKEESIDWENPHMEVWRIRRMTPAIAKGIIRLINDMIGYQYDIADFLTFGNIHLPNAAKCSDFISDPAYNASILLSDDYPICLTPDISGNADKQKTPNDLVNSEEMFRLTFQGRP